MALWYFAYGSNMEAATFRGRRGIESQRALAARAPGFRLVLDKPPLFPVGQSFANLIEDRCGEAFGVVYEINPEDLAHIEYSEGVQLGNYRRIEIAAETLATPREGLRAQTLVSEKRDPSLQPSRRYMACLIAGALEHGLPTEYLEWLRAVPACEESEEAVKLRPLLDQAIRRKNA